MLGIWREFAVPQITAESGDPVLQTIQDVSVFAGEGEELSFWQLQVCLSTAASHRHSRMSCTCYKMLCRNAFIRHDETISQSTSLNDSQQFALWTRIHDHRFDPDGF